MGGEQIPQEGLQELQGFDMRVRRREGSRGGTWEDWTALCRRWGWSGRSGEDSVVSEPAGPFAEEGCAGHCPGSRSTSVKFICSSLRQDGETDLRTAKS